MSDEAHDACERASIFLAAHGDETARRCAAVLGGDAPLAHLLEVLGEPGDDVGHWRRLLGFLGDLRALRGDLAERAVAAVAAAQRDDGSWREEEDSEEAQLFVTGMLAGYLAKTPFARPELLAAAGDFLAAHWSPQLVKGENGGACPAIAAYAHFFANVRHESGDPVMQWCGRELERGYRLRQFDAVRTARILLYCDARTIPGGGLEAGELVAAILAEQCEDGGWLDAADPSPAARSAHSLDALVALSHFGRP